ncbi:MAG TPA: ABC transporter ATP-binding protein [Methanoregulaceae archaeon]|nr:ABC transporter ATP-binding protein [Methanoregulaceae archaeon]HQJ87231.1 ABC transporter ATP-binding protein [Methanoregulaceae archaeon]
MITFERLRKEYDGVAAVDDLSLEIPRGEVFGLLGPNGAGKTTTILMLVGLIQPTSGRCLVDGIDVALEPIAVKRRMGFMPDDVGFYENMTAEQNLAYFAAIYDLPRAVRAERIADVLERLDLGGLDKKVGGYSRGMVQRLGIAKILLNDPDVLVLDEPTANLDPLCVAEYREIVRSLRAEGRTVVVSSHILSEVAKVCTSVAILARGRLVASGSVTDLPFRLAQTAGGMAIRVETRSPIPELDHPSILAAEYDANRCRARFQVTDDVRDWLVDQLRNAGVTIRELAVEEPSLEEVFMRYYHAT